MENRCHFCYNLEFIFRKNHVKPFSFCYRFVRFEAADPGVVAYHIQNSGAHANLFIDHNQIVQLACLRKGI
jgi:hypothetical protein